MNKTINFNIELRPAKTQDLMYCAATFKIDTVYYLMNPESRKLSGPYVLHKYTNSKVLERYYNSKCVYVPIMDFDFDIEMNLQQKEFKKEQELKEAGREVA